MARLRDRERERERERERKLNRRLLFSSVYARRGKLETLTNHSFVSPERPCFFFGRRYADGYSVLCSACQRTLGDSVIHGAEFERETSDTVARPARNFLPKHLRIISRL